MMERLVRFITCCGIYLRFYIVHSYRNKVKCWTFRDAKWKNKEKKIGTFLLYSFPFSIVWILYSFSFFYSGNPTLDIGPCLKMTGTQSSCSTDLRWWEYSTVCPGSSDPPEKIFQYICFRKWGFHRFLTIKIF